MPGLDLLVQSHSHRPCEGRRAGGWAAVRSARKPERYSVSLRSTSTGTWCVAGHPWMTAQSVRPADGIFAGGAALATYLQRIRPAPISTSRWALAFADPSLSSVCATNVPGEARVQIPRTGWLCLKQPPASGPPTASAGWRQPQSVVPSTAAEPQNAEVIVMGRLALSRVGVASTAGVR